jgi:hypothetical protein
VRETGFMGGDRKIVPNFKVPRQCPHFLLAEVRMREGTALGSEYGKESDTKF